MKLQSIHTTYFHRFILFMLSLCCTAAINAQTDSVTKSTPDNIEQVTTTIVKPKPVKNTFNSVWIIDNQTVMVPIKKTFEMDIMHRFGTVGKGYENFWGLFAPSNIRIGFNYSPINKLYIGFGITKDNMLWDFNAKYAIIKQTNGIYPVSVTFYTNTSYDSRKDPDNSLFRTDVLKAKGDFLSKTFGASPDRFKFFHQLIIARKINDKLSLQVAPSVSHQNAVNGYYKRVDSVTKVIAGEMNHDHFAIAFSGRYKLTNVTSVIINYDQPITKHVVNNPAPNISFGFEFTTSSHAFQLFLGNYSLLNPARNNLENTNYYKNANGKVTIKQFLIGFNVTRLWNY